MEVWKEIKELDCNYQISNLGNVRGKERKVPSTIQKCGYRVVTAKVKKPQDNGRGYKQLYVQVLNVRKMLYIHRLVATYFINNTENKEEVNHINCIKSDNRVENLEWCTKNENMKHASDSGVMVRGGVKPLPVYQITNGEVIKWNSAKEIAANLGISDCNIHKCCKGILSHVRGSVYTKIKPELLK